ncbi:MAG TPA: glycosyltransferase [Steroidobacteraceae bacterium]
MDVEILFCRELVGRGHVIDFVMQASRPDIMPGRHEWHGRSVFVGPTAAGGTMRQFLRHWLGFWHDLASLRLAVRSHYDALQVRDKFVIASIAVLVARLRGLRFFFWLSFPFPEADLIRARERLARQPAFARLRGALSGWLLYHWILPRADHAFVQSEVMKQDFVDRGLNALRLTAVPMGVDLGDIPPSPNAVQRQAGSDILLGYLGALDADRQLHMLVDMLADLRRSGMPVHLLLIGDAYKPEDRELLLRRAAECAVLPFLEITGLLPRLEALRRMKQVDIALSPIYPSPMYRVASPTKLVEYLALELPVVANDHPEQRRILEASGAGVCAPWGSRHFARGVRWLMQRTPTQRSEMGARGRAWVEQHRTYSKIADRLECSYLRLLTEPTP